MARKKTPPAYGESPWIEMRQYMAPWALLDAKGILKQDQDPVGGDTNNRIRTELG